MTRPIDGVLRRLTEIEAELPENDGVRWFNRLYREMTEAVIAVPPGGQKAPPFLEELDILFAQRYFDAFDAAGKGPGLPQGYPFKAWEPLFEARFTSGITEFQFALAGMNAHIDHDLGIATYATFEREGTGPSADKLADYNLVNGIIATVEKKAKEWLLARAFKEIPPSLWPVLEGIANFSIERAREAAWQMGKVLWGLRDFPPLREGYEAENDSYVGLLGKVMLTPLGAPEARSLSAA